MSSPRIFPFAVACAIVIGAFATVSACGQIGSSRGEARDLKGINYRDPNKAEIINNVNQHPNLVRLCIDGLAFVTSSNGDGKYAPNVLRIPEWDASYCGGVAK